MDKIINALVLAVIALGIVFLFVPLLSGIWHTIVLLVVVAGAIFGLMKIGGMWF